MIEIITGSLLDSTDTYICHQTNCVSTGSAAGIARVIFDKFPYADCYRDRLVADEPGTFELRGDGNINRFVINLHGQYKPGGPNYPGTKDLKYNDTSEDREHYFALCLAGLMSTENIKRGQTLAFNWRIGCGIAGGNWERYTDMLNAASTLLVAKGVKVRVYKLASEK